MSGTNGNGKRPALRVGVVGLGYWGPNLVRAMHEVADAQVAWICDARTDRLELISRRYPSVGTTTEYSTLLEDPSLDAILIATPVRTHFDLASSALAAGKHVFVEKPLAASSTEAHDLVRAAAERNLVLMPGHTFLYSPPVGAVRELIQSGALGQVYFVSSSRVNLGLHQPDVSVAWDLGPHDFSILRYWLGETPSYVSALSRGCIFEDTPDVAFINVEFPSGTVGHVELSWLAPSKLRRTTVVGSERMVVYDDTSNEPVRIFDSGASLPTPETFGEYRLTYRTGDIVSPRIDPTEPLILELTDFCRAIQEGNEPRSSAHLGLEVVRTIEAVDASLRLAGARVELESLPVDA
ncbi:MAG TPA: Gfo/Idh/MocA family oxidoreductase [Gaiellaceae bacterium]|jgi:predicted dehydrogenase